MARRTSQRPRCDPRRYARAGRLLGRPSCRSASFDPFPVHHSDTSEAALREFRGQLEWIFSALGIGAGATVVCYENDSGMRATRLAWALDYMGHPAARILDGGL